MKIEKIINPIAQENTYLLSNSSFKLIIDPGSDLSALMEHIDLTDSPVSGILLTHAHFDHIMGLEALKNAFPAAPIFLHEAEKDWPKDPYFNASALLLGREVAAPKADHFYKFNTSYELSDFKFRILETPGHSIGGVSLVFDEEGFVFTGDALFKNAIGRWDLPTGNHDQLIDAIEKQLFTLPEHYIVLPGHGPQTTIGTEKTFNPFFK